MIFSKRKQLLKHEYSQSGMWECTFCELDHSGSQPFNNYYNMCGTFTDLSVGLDKLCIMCIRELCWHNRQKFQHNYSQILWADNYGIYQGNYLWARS